MLKININKPLHGAKGKMNLQINLEIKQGEFLAISGESGSGKTTLLRILAGLEESEGDISMRNISWQSNEKKLPTQQRKIGFVFQDYALFENMTVEQNLLFVEKDYALAERLLEITGLTELRKRSPKMLSGGQKQRVSLCRAFMRRPTLLLLDEPLSALDPKMRTQLQDEILTLHNEFSTTTIIVSHDPSEIYRLASRMVVLDQGLVTKDGSVQEILLKKDHENSFAFTGEVLEILTRASQHIATVAINLKIIEIEISEKEAEALMVGDTIKVGTKTSAPTILESLN